METRDYQFAASRSDYCRIAKELWRTLPESVALQVELKPYGPVNMIHYICESNLTGMMHEWLHHMVSSIVSHQERESVELQV